MFITIIIEKKLQPLLLIYEWYREENGLLYFRKVIRSIPGFR